MTVQYQEKPTTLQELGNLSNYAVKLHLSTDKTLTIYQGILVKKRVVNKQDELLFCYADTFHNIQRYHESMKTIKQYVKEHNGKLIIHAEVVAEVHPLWYVKYASEYAEQKDVILLESNVPCKIVDVDAHDFDRPYLVKTKNKHQWVSEKEIASVRFGDTTKEYNAGQYLSGYEPKSKRSHVDSAVCWPYQMHMMWNELQECWYGNTHDVHKRGKIVAHAPFYQVQKRKTNISADRMRLTDLGDVINQLPIVESENDIFGKGALKNLIDDLNQGQRSTLQKYLLDYDKTQRIEHSWMDWIFEAAFTGTYSKDKQKGLLDAMHIQKEVSCHRKNILKHVIPDFAFHPKTYFQFPSTSPFFKDQLDETKAAGTDKIYLQRSAETHFDRHMPPVYLGKSAHDALQVQLQKIDQARKEFLEGKTDTYDNCVMLTQNLFQYDINEFHIDSDRVHEMMSKKEPESVHKISETVKKQITEFEEFMTTYQSTSGVLAKDDKFPWKVAQESHTQATATLTATTWSNKTSTPFYNLLGKWITHYHWPDNGIKADPETFANMYTKYRDFYKDRSAMLMQWTRGHNVFQTSGTIVPMLRLHTEADHTKLIEFLNKRIEWLNKENKNNEHQGHMHEAFERVDRFRLSSDGKRDMLTVEMLEKDMQRMHDDKCKYVCFLRNQGQKSSWWSGKSYTDIMAYYMTNQFMNDGDDMYDMAGYDQTDSIEKKLGTVQGAQRDYMYKNDLLFMFSGLVQLSACAQVIDVKTLAKAHQVNKQSMYIVRAGVMSSRVKAPARRASWLNVYTTLNVYHLHMEGLKIPIVHDSQMSLTMLINEDSKTLLQNQAKAMAIGATFSSDVGKSAAQTLGSGVGFAAGAIGAGGVLLGGSILFGGPFVLGGAALVTAMSFVGGLGSTLLGGAAVTMAHMAPNTLSEHAGYIHHNYTADDLPDGMAAYSQIQDNADIPSAADLSAEMKRRTEKGQANTWSLKTLANSALKAHCNQYMQAKDAAAKVLGLDFTNSWTEWLVSLACPVKSEAIHPLKYQHVGGS